jgi:hypothetical protein
MMLIEPADGVEIIAVVKHADFRELSGCMGHRKATPSGDSRSGAQSPIYQTIDTRRVALSGVTTHDEQCNALNLSPAERRRPGSGIG